MSGECLRVRNWDKFQHYKDKSGSVPWIKSYASILSDYDFLDLPEVDQGRLMKLWLLAARTGNRIPYDPRWVARQIGARTINLDDLVSRGFLEEVYSDSRESLDPAEQKRTEQNRAEQSRANGRYEIDERALHRLLDSLKDKDKNTAKTIRELCSERRLTEGDLMYARDCASGPGVKSPAAVAVSALQKRAEQKGTR